jgi:type I restriction enzyme, S subunit
LRFKEFKDEWLSLKANEMLESYPTNSLSWEELSFEKGNIKNIHYGLIHKGLPVITNTSDDRIPYLKSDSSSKNRSLMRPGDIIFADASEDYEGVAQAIEIGTVDTPTISGLHTIHAREKNRLYAKGFKGYLFNSPYFKKQVKTLAVGSKVNSISFRNFKDVSLSVPQSLEEQQKIASFLIAIDRRVEIQKKLIEAYESLINVLMDYAMSSEEYNAISIGELIREKHIRIIKPSELIPFNGFKEYISTSSIDKDSIIKVECDITFDNRPSRASMIPKVDSVWFAKMKNSVKVLKASKYHEKNYVLSTGFYGVLPIDEFVTSEWLNHVFLSESFNRQKDKLSEGSSMSGIKDSQLNDLTVPIFLNSEFQTIAINLLSSIQSIKKLMINQLGEYQRQRNGLLQQMFI